MAIKRWQEENLLKALTTRRVTMLIGARQCGKTTLAKQIVSDDFEYRTLDDFPTLDWAQGDLSGFIKHDKKTLIIDEIQRVPNLILAIKKAVDEDTRYGQYLITGSTNIQSLPTVKESLAGRVTKVRLRPFAYGEFIGNKPEFINRLKNKKFIDNTGFDKRKVLEIAFAGGFPEHLLNNPENWQIDYVDDLIEADLKDIANIRRQDKLKLLIEALSAYSSKEMTKSDVTSSLGISKQTLDEYINLLEKMYLIDIVFSWTKTDYERVTKQNKIFMNDTGLMSAILEWDIDEVIKNSDRSGKIVETFVYNQIVAQLDLEKGFSIYHYRDQRKREIDFLIETKDEIFGIEVKSGSSVGMNDFTHLKWFRDNLSKDKKFTGIVLYTGEKTISYGNGMYLVPMNNLWE